VDQEAGREAESTRTFHRAAVSTKYRTLTLVRPQGHERRGSKLGARVTPGHALSRKERETITTELGGGERERDVYY